MSRRAFTRPACPLIMCSVFAAAAAACGGSDGGYITSSRNALTTPASPTVTSNTSDASGHAAPTPATPSTPHGDAFGTASNVSGSCPTITFTAGNKTVATNASTKFDRGSCSTVANGVDVAARGPIQTDGSILAEVVDVRVPPPANQPTEVLTFGTIAQLSGTCPSLAFALGTQAVSTNASTTFNGTACANLANGTHVDVAGVTQSSGSILAARVDSGREHSPH